MVGTNCPYLFKLRENMNEDITQGLIASEEDDNIRFLQLAEKYRIKAASTYAEKDYLLERNGIGFSPRGNVCAISAEKKAGKTWFSMAMCAAYLKGEYLGLKSRHEGGKVLYFDTEQDEGDGQRIQRRVHFACGWDFEMDNDRFIIYHLREINAEERREFVNWAIGYYNAQLVIVDGIRDLLSDFNDLEQSAAVIQDFMRLSSQVNCCIWAILHVNPNSEKMRGHLGTELGNKVADILYMTKKKDPNNEDNTTYKMEETDARSHKDINSITFRINDAVPYGAPQMLNEKEMEQLKDDDFKMLEEIMDKYVPSPGSISQTALQKAIKTGEHIGSTKAYDLILQAVAHGIIEKAINDKYVRIHGKAITKTDEMPFEQSNEEVPY